MREKSEDYFQSVIEQLLDQKDETQHLVVGDLNTRLHAPLEEETDVLRKHIIGRGDLS